MPIGTVVRRSLQPVGRFVRPAGFAMLLALAGTSLTPGAAVAQSSPAAMTAGYGAAAINQHYAARGEAPIWLSSDEAGAGPALLELLARSDLDGLDPRRFTLGQLDRALRDASRGDPRAIARADRMLSEAFLRYVADVRAVRPSSEWRFTDPGAYPRQIDPRSLLQQAAETGSLSAFLASMPWMHESYPGLRSALAEALDRGDGEAAARLRLNMDRVRPLPAGPGRYVLVNSAAQRLYMYEDGRVVDSMRVVVGRTEQPTPVMASVIRFTALNPYWNVPNDLVAERIAPHVVKEGLGYLRAKRYVLLSDWGDNPATIDPSTVDWKKVQSGEIEVRVRQEPGAGNAMGRMKFMFPNDEGVYLHDTPDKQLLKGDARMFSAGCVRLEDAQRLATWLYGRPMPVERGGKAEQRVDLERPVPVYLAYLTAVPNGSETVFYDDIYGRDQAKLAGAAFARSPAR